jgi:hypothetical protein
MGDIKRLFSPEFRNRLDAIVPFAQLDQAVILRVVDKFLMQLEDQLHDKRVDASFTDALRAHLGKNGFDPLMGARPMQRLIQDTIRRALADELLFGKLFDGCSFIVDIDDQGKVLLTFGSRTDKCTDKAQKSVSGSYQEAELAHLCSQVRFCCPVIIAGRSTSGLCWLLANGRSANAATMCLKRTLSLALTHGWRCFWPRWSASRLPMRILLQPC